MTTTEPGALRGLAAEQQRMDALALRICAVIGQPPRPLPSRVALAIEHAARRASVVAALLTAAMLAAGTLQDDRRVHTEALVTARLLEGRLPAAHEVYAEMSGLTTRAPDR